MKKYTKQYWDYHESQGARWNKLYLNPPMDDVIVEKARLFYKDDFSRDSWVEQLRQNDNKTSRQSRTLKSFREYDFNDPLPTVVFRKGRSKPVLVDGIGRDVNWNDKDVCFPCNVVRINPNSKRSEEDILEDLKGRQNAKKQKVDNSDNDLIESMVRKIGRDELENSELAVIEKLRDIEPYAVDKQRLTKIAKKACRMATANGKKKVLRVSGGFYSPSPYTIHEEFTESLWENKPLYGWKKLNPNSKATRPPLHQFNDKGKCFQTEITDDKDYIRRSVSKAVDNYVKTGYPTEALLYITDKIDDDNDLKKKRKKLLKGIRDFQGLWDKAYNKKLDWDNILRLTGGFVPQNRARLKDGGEKRTRTIAVGSI